MVTAPYYDEPVCLFKKGERYLAVMDIELFTRQEKLLNLRAKLLEVERDRINGAKVSDKT